MRSATAALVAVLIFAAASHQYLIARQAPPALAPRIDLPNGWHLTPAGIAVNAGDFPMNIAVAPDGASAAVVNNGQSDQSVQLIDVPGLRISDSLPVRQSWLGLQFSDNGSLLYVSAGNLNRILIFGRTGDRFRLQDSIILGKPWPERISPTGLALDDSHHRLYVVTKENNSLYVIDTRQKTILSRHSIGTEGYTCLRIPHRDLLAITAWGSGELLLYDTEHDTLRYRIPAGNHPNDCCATPDGQYCFVANAQDNSVSVIDLDGPEVIETLNAALYPGAPEGSTTNSVALSADGRRLYAANADNNCLAVFDVSSPGRSTSLGFIPTGWYPTCVRVIGRTIWVANGKGFHSAPDPYGPNPVQRTGRAEEHHRQYIGSLFRGTLSVIPEPGEEDLRRYSAQVYANTPYSRERELIGAGPGLPIPSEVGKPSPIRHVFYVIKENRTYDQVLGDEPRGNGDTSLCLFPERITPNEHAIAREFVLLDNFYVDAEVSADGHNWSMAAYANDFIEKTWPTHYGGRGGAYDFAGTRPIAFPKSGFIWDNCIRHGVSVRNYGEFEENGPSKLPGLVSNSCPGYPGWNLGIHDTTRERIWEHDFDSLAAAGAVPALSVVYLPNDHTSGLSKGAFTPFAAVADNDYALGKLIEHLSASPVWNESAVFVLEDDAQDGPDHVDAHRSIAFVAGGMVKRGAVDHTPYSSTSMLRTIELILGLPPMSQYDAAAMPMYRCFTGTAGHPPFRAIPPSVDLGATNLAVNGLMRTSDSFNLAVADGVPDALMNAVLWKAIRGELSPVPPPKRGAFLRTGAGNEDD